jgi:hypothetical protein
MEYTFSLEELGQEDSQGVIQDVLTDIFRFSLLLNETQKERGGDAGISAFEAGKLYVLSLIDDPEFMKKSSYSIIPIKWGPVARSKNIGTKGSAQTPYESFLSDHLKFFAQLHPQKQALTFMTFDGKRFKPNVTNKDINKWIRNNFLNIETYEKLRVQGKIYGSLTPTEVEALASSRTNDTFYNFVMFDLHHWSTPYFKGCSEFISNTGKFEYVLNLLKDAGDWSSAARQKVNYRESKIPQCYKKMKSVIEKMNVQEQEYALQILNSIDLDLSQDSFKKCKHWSYVLNRLSTACRNSFTKCINPASKSPDSLTKDLNQLRESYAVAAGDGIAQGLIQNDMAQFAIEVREIIENNQNKAQGNNIKLGHIFFDIANKINKDMGFENNF